MVTETFNTSTRSGTLGGTMLVLMLQINWSSLLQTALVAAVGAATSFLISMCLRWLSRKYLR